jgi:hypothetical protein
MTLAEMAVALFLFSLRTLWVQREPDLSRARSRCSSR